MTTTTGSLQVATFWVGDDYYGIDVLAVREVVRVQEMTVVPLAPPEISGVINLRGELVTAIDLRRRFGLDLDDRPPASNVVVRYRDAVVSLLVDAVEDVVTLDPDRYGAAPATLQGPAREMVVGVYRLDDRLLQMLDVDAVVAVGALGAA